ncbi:hypothetical protein [Pseudoponticoccus marisrubri]|uniref:Carbohydrate kinase PfkB domain-containing protein n=1 Tax=Pseudoponticoccus marisrubri TaxID=1685382 RepID=A0A0W7WNX9_9RHOB|nr:hypothetical protein [Pseudoponticoccus marisrubri]KUF12297.1 hypothetical protein AVJ23_00740 [Pseudoponticoccus marisrubri]
MPDAAVSDIVMPSFDDEGVHLDDAAPPATRDRHAGQGATTVVGRNGPARMHVLHAGLSNSVAASPVSRVLDTTSLGDSFNAQILAGWGKYIPMADRVHHAAAMVPVDGDVVMRGKSSRACGARSVAQPEPRSQSCREKWWTQLEGNRTACSKSSKNGNTISHLMI